MRRHRHASVSNTRTEAAVLKALKLARKHGARTALDIDYRPNLWGLAGHGEGESRFIESAEVTAQAAIDAAPLRPHRRHRGGVPHRRRHHRHHRRAPRRARRLRRHPRLQARRRWAPPPSTAPIPTSLDDGQTGPGFPIEVFNVLGAGDGFMSGLLKGWLDGQDWPTSAQVRQCLRRLRRLAATAAPRPIPAGTNSTSSSHRGVVRPDLRNDEALEQIHWSTNRHASNAGDWSAMRVFAFDHRMQLEEMPGATPARIGAFKQLCLQAALQVAGRPPRLRHPLRQPARPRRAARAPPAPASGSAGPCEWPGSRPLTLEPELGRDFGGLSRMAAGARGQGALLLPPGRRRRTCGASRRPL